MMRKFLPLVLLAPLTIAACSSGQSATTATTGQDQAMVVAQQALTTAQQAQTTANQAKQEADRMNQRNLTK